MLSFSGFLWFGFGSGSGLGSGSGSGSGLKSMRLRLRLRSESGLVSCCACVSMFLFLFLSSPQQQPRRGQSYRQQRIHHVCMVGRYIQRGSRHKFVLPGKRVVDLLWWILGQPVLVIRVVPIPIFWQKRMCPLLTIIWISMFG